LDLENFQKISKKNCKEFFQGISRKNYFGPYRNFPTLVKNFKNFKSSVEGLNTFFFFSFFVFVSWIGTLTPRTGGTAAEWSHEDLEQK
jgi:hypothetical protein